MRIQLTFNDLQLTRPGRQLFQHFTDVASSLWLDHRGHPVIFFDTVQIPIGVQRRRCMQNRPPHASYFDL